MGGGKEKKGQELVAVFKPCSVVEEVFTDLLVL